MVGGSSAAAGSREWGSKLERTDPGIMRPIYLRTERFNQDLRPGALLVEVGAAGNTLQEALYAAEALGHAIGALRFGANGG
jgi:stage II sporulation protein P